MIKSALLTALLFNGMLVLYGQDTFYIDQSCNKTEKSSAIYKRVIEQVDNHYIVKDYYLSGQLFMEAACVYARTTKVFYHGKCDYYYEDGKKRITGYFSNNNPTDIWKYFSKDGMDSITTRFENGNQNFIESSFNNRSKDRSNSKKDSVRTNSDSLSEKPDEQLIMVANDAEYPGGKKALVKYIKKDFHYPQEALNRRISGMVKIYFEVDITGEVKNVKLLGRIPIGFGLEEEAMRIMKNMSTIWIPATLNGKPGKQKRSIPINYILPEL